MLKVNDLSRIYLGVQGENEARTITIDVRPWLVAHPGGSVTIWHKRNGDATPSATGAVFASEEGTVSWTPTSTDTYVSGEGEAEIRLTVGTVIKKSRKVVTGVSPSVTLAGTPLGSDWQSYINAVDGIRAAAVTAKTAAEAAQSAAETAEENAEAWATGKRNGEDVGSTDPTYHNNAEYYAGKAKDAYDDTVETKTSALEAIANAKTDAIQAMDTEGQAIIGQANTAVSHYPYVNPETRTWYIWNVAEGRWINTGIMCEGIPGPEGKPGGQGPEGKPGKPGQDGRNAVVIEIGAVEYYFQIDGEGHLIMTYGGDTAPDFHINSQGHLIYSF